MKMKVSILLRLLLLVSFVAYIEAGAWLWPRVAIASTSPNPPRDIPTPIEVAEESSDASEDSEYTMSTENHETSGQMELDSMDATGEATTTMDQDQLKKLYDRFKSANIKVPSSEYEDTWRIQTDKIKIEDVQVPEVRRETFIPAPVIGLILIVVLIYRCMRLYKACLICCGSSYEVLNDEHAIEENDRNPQAPGV